MADLDSGEPGINVICAAFSSVGFDRGYTGIQTQYTRYTVTSEMISGANEQTPTPPKGMFCASECHDDVTPPQVSGILGTNYGITESNGITESAFVYNPVSPKRSSKIFKTVVI